MIDELLGECVKCDKPVLESEGWRLNNDELCHKGCGD